MKIIAAVVFGIELEAAVPALSKIEWPPAN